MEFWGRCTFFVRNREIIVLDLSAATRITRKPENGSASYRDWYD